MTQIDTPPPFIPYTGFAPQGEQPVAVIKTLNTTQLLALMQEYFDGQADIINQLSNQYAVNTNQLQQLLLLNAWQGSSAMQEKLSEAIPLQIQGLGIPENVQAELVADPNFTAIVGQLTNRINQQYTQNPHIADEMEGSSQINPHTNQLIPTNNGIPNGPVDDINTGMNFLDSLTAFANGNGPLDLNELLNAPVLDFGQLQESGSTIEILNLLIQRLTIQLSQKASKSNEQDAFQEQSRIRADNERALQQLKTAQEKQKEANSSTSGGKIAGYVVAALGLLASAILTAVSLGTATAVAATIAVVSFAVAVAFTAASMSGGIDKAVEAAAKSAVGDDPSKLAEAKQGFAAMFAVLQVLIAVLMAIASFGANIGPAVNAAAKIASDSAKEAGKAVANEVAKAVVKEIANQLKNAMTKMATMGLKQGTAEVTQAVGRSVTTTGQIISSAANLTAAGVTVAQVGTSLYSATKNFQAAKLQQQATEANANKETAEASADAGREIIKLLLDLIAQINQAMNDQIKTISDVLETRKQATDNIDQQFAIA